MRIRKKNQSYFKVCYRKEFFLGKKLMFSKSSFSLLNPRREQTWNKCKRHIYDVKENNVRLLRVILKLDVCEDIVLITLYYLKVIWYGCFHVSWCSVFHSLPLLHEYIRLRGSTSSAEQNYIVTIYDSCKYWILAYKIGNQIHTIFKERKNPLYSFVVKMATVIYMFYAIFAPNSMAKFFKNTCLRWSWRSCNFTKNYLELFRTIQNYC